MQRLHAARWTRAGGPSKARRRRRSRGPRGFAPGEARSRRRGGGEHAGLWASNGMSRGCSGAAAPPKRRRARPGAARQFVGGPWNLLALVRYTRSLARLHCTRISSPVQRDPVRTPRRPTRTTCARGSIGGWIRAGFAAAARRPCPRRGARLRVRSPSRKSGHAAARARECGSRRSRESKVTKRREPARSAPARGTNGRCAACD